MEIGADESQTWGPDASTVTPTVLPGLAKAEKGKPDEMLPEIFLTPSRAKKRKTIPASRKISRKVVYHDSFDFAGEGMDGNPLGGTSLE